MSSVMLTPEEARELKSMCDNPFLELGMTLRPKHHESVRRKIATHAIQVVILFEAHEDAVKWNKMHEARIRKGNHEATIALSFLLYALGAGAAGTIGVESAVSIAKNVVRARTWYPEMFTGWLLTRYYDFLYLRFPRQHFYMSWTDIIQNEKDEEQERRKHGRMHFPVGGSAGLPESLVRDLMTRFPLHTFKFK